MKKIHSTVLLIIVSIFCIAQVNEKRVMKESHIDFSKEVILFSLHGFIEIDGHIFNNDTCKCAIIYTANLTEITIQDTCTKTFYKYRKCEKQNCKIIHLTYDTPIYNGMDNGIYVKPFNSFRPYNNIIQGGRINVSDSTSTYKVPFDFMEKLIWGN